MAGTLKSAIKAAAVPTIPKASKSTVPNLEVPAAVKAAAARYVSTVKKLKELEADKANDHYTVSTFVSGVQDEKALAGNFNKSYRIPLEGDDNLTVTTVNKFKINPEDEDTIKKLLGKSLSQIISTVIACSRKSVEKCLKKKGSMLNETIQEKECCKLRQNK